MLSYQTNVKNSTQWIFNFIRDLITEHQSGFTINDSTRNQLLYIANMFSKALDEGKEIRVIIMFLSSFLWTGVTFASFHLFGKCLVIKLMLKIAHNGLEII
jgi:hypothetical protein